MKRVTGIRKWKGAWQCYIEVQGKTYSKSFPLSADLDEMREWRTSQRKKFKKAGPVNGSFAKDITDYLSRVTAMPTYQSRSVHLTLWADALGHDRPRRSITTAEIDQVLQGWLLAGLSSSTVRKRRTALLSLWHKLDGKHASNPVRASAAPREPKPEARGLPYATIARLLDVMPPSASKLRIAVMAWTGLPPKMVGELQPGDLNLTAQTVRVRPRRKGAGVEARTLPLLPQAVAAFRAFDRGKVYGRYSISSCNQCFQRACQRLDPPVTGVSLYDLRHSFGTMLYRVTRDLATVSRFLLHASVAMSERYAAGAMTDVDREAAQLAGSFLSQKPVPTGKQHKDKHLDV